MRNSTTALGRLLFLAALAVGVAGCGPSDATLKGKVVKDGQPVGSQGQQVSVNFHPVSPDGTPDAGNSYIAKLNDDATFEFVASGGTLPPGQYRVAIVTAGSGGRDGGGPGPEGFTKPKKGEKKTSDRFAPHHSLATSKLNATIAAGRNDLVLDLGKPSE